MAAGFGRYATLWSPRAHSTTRRRRAGGEGTHRLVTLKIAGLVVALLMGFGFTPTYLDYMAVGQGLRRAFAQSRANPSFVVGAVLACASMIPIVLLGWALITAPSLAAVVVGFLLAFFVAAMAAVVLTPAPRALASGPPPRSYIEQFMAEE